MTRFNDARNDHNMYGHDVFINSTLSEGLSEVALYNVCAAENCEIQKKAKDEAILREKFTTPPTPEELTAIHVHVENFLIEMRDDCISMPFHANGLVVKSREGEPSPIIRLGTRDAVNMIVKKFIELRS